MLKFLVYTPNTIGTIQDVYLVYATAGTLPKSGKYIELNDRYKGIFDMRMYGLLIQTKHLNGT